MQKKLLILAVVALFLIGGVAFVWQKRTSKEMSQGEPKEEVKIVENTNPNNVDTSDWKTYRNEEYGFEMRYPKSWNEPRPFQLTGGNMRTYISDVDRFEGCCRGVRIEIKQDLSKNVYENKLSNLLDGELLDEAKRSIDGIEIREILYDTHYGENERVSFIPAGASTVELGRAGIDVQAEQVVSTFRFINK